MKHLCSYCFAMRFRIWGMRPMMRIVCSPRTSTVLAKMYRASGHSPDLRISWLNSMMQLSTFVFLVKHGGTTLRDFSFGQREHIFLERRYWQ